MSALKSQFLVFIFPSAHSNVTMSFVLSLQGPLSCMENWIYRKAHGWIHFLHTHTAKPKRHIPKRFDVVKCLLCLTDQWISLNLFWWAVCEMFALCSLTRFSLICWDSLLFLSFDHLVSVISCWADSEQTITYRWSFATVGKCSWQEEMHESKRAIKADVIVRRPEEGTLSGLGTRSRRHFYFSKVVFVLDFQILTRRHWVPWKSAWRIARMVVRSPVDQQNNRKLPSSCF